MPKNGESQSSLHTFFTARPSAQTGRNVDDAVDLTSPPPAKRARLHNEESQPASQSSRFFKPKLKPTASSTTGPSETRTTLESFRAVGIGHVQDARPGSAFGSFNLPYTGGGQSQRTEEQERRHLAWQEVVAGRGVMPRRRSLVLDEAEAAAAAAEAREDESGEEDKTKDVALTLRNKFVSKEEPKKRGRKKKVEEVGPSGETYTPLEKQYMAIKEMWPDVLLFMEVGYKYKFHGEDAKNAARELGIMAFPVRNFYIASIPVHRLQIHVKKLISLGYKVGVVSQMETAALKKVGDNRNTPFTRELTHLYTAATYVEEPSVTSSTERDNPPLPGAVPPSTNALVAVIEQELDGVVADDRVKIALVSVVPGTGDVVWDEFEDSPVRSELETRLTHLQPSELLLPEQGLSKATEKVLKHITGTSRSATAVRVERLSTIPTYNDAFDSLTAFYKQKKGKGKSPIDLTGDEEGATMADAKDAQGDSASDLVGLAAGLPDEEAVLALVDFPKQVVVAFAMTVTYMTAFGLQNAFRHRSSFTKFINRAHMLLSSNTLVNLEIYRNQTDGGQNGSLLWLMDHTKTRMGRRLMREWIGRPLLDVEALRARCDAVEEITTNNTYHMEKLRSLLTNMPDLVRGLTRVQYGKATPTELATLLVGLVRVASEFRPNQGNVFKSKLLNNIINTLPTILETAKEFHSALDMKAARANTEADLWTDPDRYPDIQDAKDCIMICESELASHLKQIRKVVHRPALNYATVAGIEYLVEIPTRDVKTVPPKWVKISSTRTVARFHTPEILSLLKEREQHKETLAAAAKRAFQSFQADIGERHELVVVSRHIAVIDCLISLATVALAGGYTKPTFVAEPRLDIIAGRHPMVEALREDAYVPFDISFSDENGRAKVITGPNMAGKSSCVRATALIVCMAQIGSFVPAQSVTLGIHDAVQTRMGASDDISRGKSTFMVELSETSDILRTVTPRTLVILDELGRGTSTYDGEAIAYATLAHLAQLQCNTLFVTHYPMVAEQLAQEYPEVSNWHMGFTERTGSDGYAEITFLYRLERGLADASFGVWCARLAGLPVSILERAQLKSDSLKVETRERGVAAMSARLRALMDSLGGDDGDVLRAVARLESAAAFVGA